MARTLPAEVETQSCQIVGEQAALLSGAQRMSLKRGRVSARLWKELSAGSSESEAIVEL